MKSRRRTAIGRGTGLVALASAAFAAVSCTPLTAFNTPVPKDRGASLVISDASYGAGPRQKLDIYRPRMPVDPSARHEIGEVDLLDLAEVG